MTLLVYTFTTITNILYYLCVVYIMVDRMYLSPDSSKTLEILMGTLAI